LFCVTLFGQVIVHGVTVTVKLQEFILPDASLTVQATVVAPTGKHVPDGGLHVGEPTPGQLSLTVGLLKLTTAHVLFVDAIWSAGQVRLGACMSLTVTVNMQLDMLPDASLTEQVTVVTPLENVEPEAGMQVTEPTPGQLSVAVGVV
jgi:hypothetical protein